jgi:hypothetical protein
MAASLSCRSCRSSAITLSSDTQRDSHLHRVHSSSLYQLRFRMPIATPPCLRSQGRSRLRPVLIKTTIGLIRRSRLAKEVQTCLLTETGYFGLRIW